MNPDLHLTHFETHQLTVRRSPRISLITLLLCLCAGSLAIVVLLNGVGLFGPGISGADLENQLLFDEIEFDEDFFIVTLMGTFITNLPFPKSRQMNLDFIAAGLSPVSPPPKY